MEKVKGKKKQVKEPSGQTPPTEANPTRQHYQQASQGLRRPVKR